MHVELKEAEITPEFDTGRCVRLSRESTTPQPVQ
jgi:hypothetical protein